jgi:dolichol kinase
MAGSSHRRRYVNFGIGLMVELSSLVAVSILYMATRHRVPTGPVRSPTTISFARPGSPGLLSSYGNHVRERATRMSHSTGTQTTPISAIREDLRRISPTGHEEIPEPKGAVWGTEARDYRDCPDDGALFALLLAPLVAAGMLHASLDHLSAAPDTPLPKEWNIESPLVLHSTPIRFLQGITLFPTDAIRALSALATSRRNLVQLFTLCSFVLLVHLARSLHLENKQAKAAGRSTSPVPGNGVSMERDLSGPNANTGTYWLKRGEWKRTKSVVGFSFLVTVCCLGVKVVTALIGRGVWSGMSTFYLMGSWVLMPDMSPSDIVIATLFYQFSLYVCVRLARRGFTLGELAVVCNAATALFMETVNITRMKVSLPAFSVFGRD